MTQTITIHNIFISSGHDFKGRFGKGRRNNGVSAVTMAECVAGQGLVGDRYFGYKTDYKGQLSLISLSAIRELELELARSPLDYSLFRRNLVVSGVDLNELVGKGFQIGEVELLGVERCEPCFWMDEAIAPGACAAMESRGGLRCRIHKSGRVRLGEAAFRRLDRQLWA